MIVRALGHREERIVQVRPAAARGLFAGPYLVQAPPRDAAREMSVELYPLYKYIYIKFYSSACTCL